MYSVTTAGREDLRVKQPVIEGTDHVSMEFMIHGVGSVVYQENMKNPHRKIKIVQLILVLDKCINYKLQFLTDGFI